MFSRQYVTQQYGQTIVMFAIVVPVLLGMLGLAFDVGNIYYVQRGRLQNTADAAVLAGAYGLPDEKMAESIAQKYIELNPVNGTPKVSYQYSADNSKMTITLQLNVTAYFMRIFGTGFENRDITVTATAGAAGAKLPAYAMFSGDTTQGSAGIVMEQNGTGFMDDGGKMVSGMLIYGDIHSNNNLNHMGRFLTVHGKSVEAVGSIVRDENNENFDTTCKEGVGIINLADCSSSIEAAAATQNQIYTGSKAYMGNELPESPVYIKGKANTLTINGTDFKTNALVMADGNIIINAAGKPQADKQAFFYSKTGDINLDYASYNEIDVNVVLYAPNGTIRLSSRNPGSVISINGSIMGKLIYLSGKGSFQIRYVAVKNTLANKKVVILTSD